MRPRAIRFNEALVLSAAVLLAGCSMDIRRDPISLRQGAEDVRLASGPPSAECVELGEIVGLTDRNSRIRFSKPEIVDVDQRNALKNAASELGGDYVFLHANDPKSNSGTAFRCDTTLRPPSVAPSVAPNETAPAPVVKQNGSGEPAPLEQSDSIKARLRLLQSLYEDGLITSKEYAAKKKAILDEL